MSAHGQALPTLPAAFNGTPLQNEVFNAVINTCVTLDELDTANTPTGAITTQTRDLHRQCHGIVAGALTPGAASSAAANVLGALQQVSGNDYSSQGALATRVVTGQFTNISARLGVLRMGTTLPGQFIAFNNSFSLDRNSLDASSQGDSIAPRISLPLAGQGAEGALMNTAFVGGGSAPALRADAASGGGGSTAPTVPNPLGLYVQGSYNSGHHDATDLEDPFDFHATSITLGLDYNFGNAVLGVSAGYDDYDATFKQLGTYVSGGSSQVESGTGSIYGAWFDQHWNFNAIATWGVLRTHQSRIVSYTVPYNATTVPPPLVNPLFASDCTTPTTCGVAVNRTLEGNPNGSIVAIGATAGYSANLGGFDIDPSLSLNYRRAGINAFAESSPNPPTGGDGLALAFGDQVVESFRSIVGVGASRPFSVPFGVLTPLVRAEWDHEFLTGQRFIQAQYATTIGLSGAPACLSCFTLPTDRPVANYGIVGGGLSVLLSHRVQAFVYDEVLVGYSNYSSNSIAVGIRGQF
jgi:uncharacterized protein YhjY with autotransporter beta-barrel domain